MKWDKSWEEVYSAQGYRAIYPNENIIRFIVSKYGGTNPLSNINNRSNIKILDLGCGSGRHIVYLKNEGFLVCGIDGSKTAISYTKKWLDKLNIKADVRVGSLSELPYKTNYFDAVIDYESIQHNSLGNAKLIIKEIFRVLKPEGYLFSMIRSTKDYLYNQGVEVEKNTFINIPYGDLKSAGRIRFYTEDEIYSIFKEFNIISIEETSRTINNRKNKIVEWIVTAKK